MKRLNRNSSKIPSRAPSLNPPRFPTHSFSGGPSPPTSLVLVLISTTVIGWKSFGPEIICLETNRSQGTVPVRSTCLQLQLVEETLSLALSHFQPFIPLKEQDSLPICIIITTIVIGRKPSRGPRPLEAAPRAAIHFFPNSHCVSS